MDTQGVVLVEEIARDQFRVRCKSDVHARHYELFANGFLSSVSRLFLPLVQFLRRTGRITVNLMSFV